ncbi:MAG: 50S ribosomal protein L6 [Candidatus Levybacteria bacterium]|nr:50S ribosomal protein L6 [Candidatus Levybacteria bacterium]
MSKIGKQPIAIIPGATITIADRNITVAGPKTTMHLTLLPGIVVSQNDGFIVVSQKNTDGNTSAAFGLTRSLLANMVQGVTTGFEKKLEMSGVGYRAAGSGADLTLSVGFSHPVKFKAPEGISFAVADNVITVSGADKMMVGDIAAKIRATRPPEPYKGKGIKYMGEKVRRKVGKAAKAVGGK